MKLFLGLTSGRNCSRVLVGTVSSCAKAPKTDNDDTTTATTTTTTAVAGDELKPFPILAAEMVKEQVLAGIYSNTNFYIEEDVGNPTEKRA